MIDFPFTGIEPWCIALLSGNVYLKITTEISMLYFYFIIYSIFYFIFHRPTNGSQVVLCLAFGLAVVIGSFCLQTVTERATKAKHIQFVSGVYLLTYWLSALLWDLIYFFITCCFLLVSVSWICTKAYFFFMSPIGNFYSINCILK